MPNTESAKKRLRQTEKRTLANKQLRSAMRTHQKRLLELIEAGDKAGAAQELTIVQHHFDKAAKQHIIHRNTAANQKSRLARKVAALS